MPIAMIVFPFPQDETHGPDWPPLSSLHCQPRKSSVLVACWIAWVGLSSYLIYFYYVRSLSKSAQDLVAWRYKRNHIVITNTSVMFFERPRTHLAGTTATHTRLRRPGWRPLPDRSVSEPFVAGITYIHHPHTHALLQRHGTQYIRMDRLFGITT